MKILAKEAKFNPAIYALYITDTKGNMYFLDGTSADTADYPYFKTSITGKRFFSEPYMDPSINKFIMDISVPVYGDENNIIGVLIAAIDGLWLSEQIKDIVVGQTGECYILGLTGNVIAYSDENWVINQKNAQEEAKKDYSLAILARFEKKLWK